MVTVEQFLSQKWINENKYFLTAKELTKESYLTLIEQGFTQLGLLNPRRLSYSKDKDIPFCNWVRENVFVQPHHYDVTFPLDYAAPPAIFFEPAIPYRMLLYVMDMENLSNPFLQSHFLDKYYESKSDDYMPKSLLFEYVELAWLAYDDHLDCLLLHHNQINGDLAWCLSPNLRLWFYRYLIRTFVQRVPINRRHQIFVPTIETYLKFMSRKMKHERIAVFPYGKEVMQKSDFRIVDYSEFEKQCPNAALDCDLIKYLDRSEISFWTYEHDNPYTLANTCLG